MTQKMQDAITIRDQMIAGLERESKIQTELIKEQKVMIQILTDQNAKLRKMLEDILKA